MGIVTVRTVGPDDLEEFLDWFERYWAELEELSEFDDPFSRVEYGRLLLQPNGRRFWWADVDGPHVGFCVFTIGDHWYRRDVTDGYVDEFYIAPEARRSGHGTQLARLMLAEFSRRNVRQIELSVLPRNAPARAFWAGLGFSAALLRMARRPERNDLSVTG